MTERPSAGDLDLPEPGCAVADVADAFVRLSDARDDVVVPSDDLDAETAFCSAVVEELAPTDVFWDVGAHAGLFSAAVRLVADPERVVGFEPNPHVFPVLETVLASLPGANAAHNVAIADATGRRTFAVDPGGGTESTFPETDSIASEYDAFETVAVQTRTVQDLLDGGEPVPDVVKVDVEGAEDEVLRCLDPILPDLRTLFVEVHHLDRRFAEVDAFFEARDLSVEVLETRHQTETCYQEFVRVDV